MFFVFITATVNIFMLVVCNYLNWVDFFDHIWFICTYNLFFLQAVSGSTSSAEMSNAEEEKSETYSSNMTEAMGAGKFIHATSSGLRLNAWGGLGSNSVGVSLYVLVK